METNTEDSKAVEKATMEKLLDIASRMMRVEEIYSTLICSRKPAVRDDDVYRQYLLQRAEIAQLDRALNEALRDHEIHCGCCGQKHKLREVKAVGVIPAVSLLCPIGFFHKGNILEEPELDSIRRLLRFATCNPMKIFYS